MPTSSQLRRSADGNWDLSIIPQHHKSSSTNGDNFGSISPSSLHDTEMWSTSPAVYQAAMNDPKGDPFDTTLQSPLEDTLPLPCPISNPGNLLRSSPELILPESLQQLPQLNIDFQAELNSYGIDEVETMPPVAPSSEASRHHIDTANATKVPQDTGSHHGLETDSAWRPSDATSDEDSPRRPRKPVRVSTTNTKGQGSTAETLKSVAPETGAESEIKTNKLTTTLKSKSTQAMKRKTGAARVPKKSFYEQGQVEDVDKSTVASKSLQAPKCRSSLHPFARGII